MSLLPLIVLGATFTAQGPPADDAEKTVRDYFETLCQDRERITSGYLEYTVKLDVFNRSDELTGSEYTYNFWFNKSQRRLDVNSIHPKAPDRNLNSRYAFDEKAYRIIDVDRANFVVREFTSAFLEGEPPRVLPMGAPLDPRVIGIDAMEYGLLIHSRLDTFRDLNLVVAFAAERTRIDGLDALELTVRNPKNLRSFVVPKGAILPARMTAQFGARGSTGGPPYPIRVEVESEVASWPNDRGERFAFPKTVKARRLVNGSVESAETLTVRKVNFNVPVPESVLTWKGLQPPIGAGLVSNGEYQRSADKAVQWDGERFVSVVVPPISSNDLEHGDDDP